MTNFNLNVPHAEKSLWNLDPNISFLNFGSFGATPKPILEKQTLWRTHMEKNPVEFMLEVFPEELRRQRAILAKFVDTDSENLAFCRHATQAIGSILQALDFKSGDEVIVTDHGYNAVAKALSYWVERVGLVVKSSTLKIPYESPENIVEGIRKQISAKTKLILVDHITSASAMVLPVEQIVTLAKQHSIPILIDGAHVPGHMALSLRSLQPDFYVGNLHKWCFSPKGCALLYVDPKHQPRIRPNTISHYYKQGFQQEYDWQGSDDYTSWLCVSECLSFIDSLGGQKSLSERNHQLVREAWLESAKVLGCTLPYTDDIQHYPSIAALPLPPKSGSQDSEVAWNLRKKFRHEYHCEVLFSVIKGTVWFRLSAQAFNCFDDYKPVFTALKKEFT